MQKILLSACLLGQTVRYDGSHKLDAHPILQTWLEQGRVLMVCPEVSAGLPVPRPAAEIGNAGNGAQVLLRQARVVEQGGRDVSAAFIAGAEHALQLAQRHQILIALLKEGSPSCGTQQIYDGSFNGKTIPGQGVTAALLRQAGIYVYNELQWEQADARLREIEAQEPTVRTTGR